jgi:hypothetical protein
MQSAATKYHEARNEAIALLSSIQWKVENRKGSGLTESASWGDAEQMAHLCRQLREIEDRLYRKGEYAPDNAAR